MNRSKNIIIILIVVIAVLIISLIGAIVYILIDNNKIDNNTADNTAENDTSAVIEDETENAAEFNEVFEAFEGTEITSDQIRVLLFEINTNNTDENNENTIYLNEDGITDINQLDDSKTYTVEIFYNDEGYINEIKITENSIVESGDNGSENTAGDMEKMLFNSKFMLYEGEITGERLNIFLQEAMESNNNYPEHQVNLSSNNLQTLEGIVATDIYIISFSQDENGYINNINIDKKINSVENRLEEMELRAFNSKFKSYEGEATASHVKALINTIKASNASGSGHLVTTNISNEDDIETRFKYVVTLSYDDNGYVNNINIEKKI